MPYHIRALMKWYTQGLIALAFTAMASGCATTEHAARIRAADVIEFGPDNTLFVGDARGGVVHAVQLPQRPERQSAPFNIDNVDALLAKATGRPRDAIRVRDLQVHPESGEVVLALAVRCATGEQPALAFVEPSGNVDLLWLDSPSKSQLQLANRPDPDLVFWDETPAAAYTITDIAWFDDKLYVSGLGNGTFASSLRRAEYPFRGPTDVATVEMYHAVHHQMETRAPIESFEIVSLEGRPYVLAAYLCTPIVTFPLSEVQDGAHITAKTIAELGWGNQPIDLIRFTMTADYMKGPHFLLTNKQRHAMLMSEADIARHNKMAGLSDPVPFPVQSHAGVPVIQIPFGHVSHIADQNEDFLVGLTRHKISGRLELSSRRKALFLRITEFIDEYDFPGYVYDNAPNADFQKKYLQPTRSLLMQDEGKASHAK